MLTIEHFSLVKNYSLRIQNSAIIVVFFIIIRPKRENIDNNYYNNYYYKASVINIIHSDKTLLLSHSLTLSINKQWSDVIKMGDFISNEIIDMILILGKCRGVYVDAAVLYTQRFPRRRHSYNVMIRNLITKARAGQMTRQHRHHEYDENDVRVLTILASVYLDPHISSRKLEVSTEIPKFIILRILKVQKCLSYHFDPSIIICRCWSTTRVLPVDLAADRSGP